MNFRGLIQKLLSAVSAESLLAVSLLFSFFSIIVSNLAGVSVTLDIFARVVLANSFVFYLCYFVLEEVFIKKQNLINKFLKWLKK